MLLVIIIDRGYRELPIQPDFVEERYQLVKGAHIFVAKSSGW